jgi:tetratricopeptide (TPR) repeat protein
VALTASACSPPNALRKLFGKPGDEPVPTVNSNDFPAPAIPNPPAQLLFGTIILTNEPSWGIFLKRGQNASGALVLDVLPDTPAKAAGLVAGDVITGIDGSDVNNHEQLLVAFRNDKTTEHDMKVKRVDGNTIDVKAKLIPAGSFSLLSYLQTKFAASPDPITRYLLAEQEPDVTKAMDILNALIAEHPDFAEGYALLARRLLDRVETNATGGTTGADFVPSTDIQDMTTAINKAVSLDPQAPSIYRERSQINLSLGDAANAEADASKALQMDEMSAETQYLLGTSRLTLGRATEAIEGLHLAVQLDPFEPRYYINLAVCYRGLNRESDAKTTIAAAKSLVTDPTLRQQLDELAQTPPQSSTN